MGSDGRLKRTGWLLLGAMAVMAAPALATTPPKQPDAGPGGAEYPIGVADVAKEAVGTGAQQAFIFRPSKGFEGPRPVVVFGHAVNAFNPKIYGAWIDHLARRGSIVVFPRYQNDNRTPRNEVIGHAAAGVKLAFAKLGDAADLTKVAYVGHAAGGNILANLAAMPDLPKPRLLFAIMPGNSWGNRYQAVTLNELDKLPADLLLITMTGDTDSVAKDTDARKIIRQSTAVPAARKMIVRLPTDNHGSPALFATHYTPMARHDAYDMTAIPVTDAAPAPVQLDRRGRPIPPRAAAAVQAPQPEEFGGALVDVADWWGFWKTLDIAMPAAFAGEDTTPIRRHPQMTTLGQWSDGWPLKRLTIETPREPHAAPAAAETPAPQTPRR